MAELREDFYAFASQRLAEAYKRFRSTDHEYQEIECYLNVHSKRFDTVLSALNEADQNFIEDYISKQAYEAMCANEKLYIAGYRDCVALLKEIGVL